MRTERSVTYGAFVGRLINAVGEDGFCELSESFMAWLAGADDEELRSLLAADERLLVNRNDERFPALVKAELDSVGKHGKGFLLLAHGDALAWHTDGRAAAWRQGMAASKDAKQRTNGA